jgi:hypothetical protein
MLAPSGLNAQQTDSISTPAWDTLAGELPELVINNGKPYFVAADIIVPPGKTVVIEPGTILLFHTFTGLQVHGVLLARGSEEAPILFSSENDAAQGGLASPDPAPYDWNGITLYENALGTTFSHCSVTYSLFGINSLCDQVFLKNCRFNHNGKSDFTAMGERQNVGESPFSWGEQAEEAQPAVVAASVDTVHSRTVGRKVGLRIVCIGLLGVGAAGGALEYSNYRASRARFDALNATDNRENLKNPSIIEEWNAAQKALSRDRGLMIGGVALAALGAIGFGISFVW